MNEKRNYPAREEQVRLSQQIQNGIIAALIYRTVFENLSQSLPGIKLLLSGALNKLVATMRLGKKAESQILSKNLGLVAVEARKLWLLRRFRLLAFEDLVQEGCCGLLEAARRYDPDKGTQFSTYATYWVKQVMRRSTFLDSVVRLPEHIFLKKNREKYEKYIKQFAYAHSLDETFYNDTNCLYWAQDEFFEEELSDAHLKLDEAAARNLTAREREVLGRTFGTFGYEPEDTKQAIAGLMGVCRSTVGKIERQAIGKLKLAIAQPK